MAIFEASHFPITEIMYYLMLNKNVIVLVLKPYHWMISPTETKQKIDFQI